MKKLFRYLIIGIVAAIAFLVAIIAIFVAVFDANAYKDELSQLVQERTGRDLQFHGDVSLTIFPALGMKLGAMSFSNAEGFGAKPMVKVKEASISVDLASLIAFSPEIDQFVLRDLEINLVRNKAGVTNWDDLVPKAKPGDAGEAATAQTEKDSGDGGAIGISGAFGGLDLQNISLSWRDEQAGSEFLIRDLDIATGRIVPNEAFPLTLQLDANADGFDVRVDLKSDIEYLIAEQKLTLENMALALNEFNIGGRLQVSNFAKPVLGFDLESEKLDVDALLGTLPPSPEPATEADGEAVATGSSEDVRIALPMQTLRDLDIDGRLQIAWLKAQNLVMSDVDMIVKAKRGVISIDPLKLQTYEGLVDTRVSIDVRGELPRYQVSKTIRGVKIGKLMRDFAAIDTLNGTLNAEVSATTGGEWLSELKRQSNGKLKLEFVDGAINGFNIRQSIEAAKARLRGETPSAKETLKTDFSALSLTGVIENGVFRSDDLNLQAPALRVGGRGSADLNREFVDYLVNAKLVGSVEGQGSAGADELAGLAIPVRIKGPFAAPKIDVQLDEMLKARADAEKAKLQAEIAAQKEALKQQLEAEKKALEEAQRRELEKRKEIEKTKLEQKKKEAEKKLLEKLLD